MPFLLLHEVGRSNGQIVSPMNSYISIAYFRSINNSAKRFTSSEFKPVGTRQTRSIDPLAHIDIAI